MSTAATGSGTGSATTAAAAAAGRESTLDATMRAPSATEPEVIVIREGPEVVEEKKRVLLLDPNKDLWISTVDGRHQSPIIPIRVGPFADTFYVHRDVLTRATYFRTALLGHFSEASSQSLDFPEEDPSVFSFVIAFLYEGTFKPIKPVADVLVPELEKGKGKETEEELGIVNSSSSDSETSLSDDSARSRRAAETRRRRQQRAWEERNRKEIGRHRPDCTCATCVVDIYAPHCWNCGVPRTRPQQPLRPGQPPYWFQPPPPPPPNNPNVIYLDHHRRGPPPQHPPPIQHPPVLRMPSPPFMPEPRMSPEDLRSWLLTLNLSISVYICASRYLLQDFQPLISAHITDMFETAGMQAADPAILRECRRLWDAFGHLAIAEGDVLVRKVFARTGFLLTRLWREYEAETLEWWCAVGNAEVGARIMREMGERREVDRGRDLPPMERLGGNVVWGGPPPPPPPQARPRRRRELADD